MIEAINKTNFSNKAWKINSIFGTLYDNNERLPLTN